MIYRGHVVTNDAEPRLSPFHLGAAHCMRYRELRSPWVSPCIEQLRYLLGFITYALREDEECVLPDQVHWKRRRGIRRDGKYRAGPWDAYTKPEHLFNDGTPRGDEVRDAGNLR